MFWRFGENLQLQYEVLYVCFLFSFCRILRNKNLSEQEDVVRFCKMLYHDKMMRSPHLLACMLDIEEDRLENNVSERQVHLKEATRVSVRLLSDEI